MCKLTRALAVYPSKNKNLWERLYHIWPISFNPRKFCLIIADVITSRNSSQKTYQSEVMKQYHVHVTLLVSHML